MNAADWANHYEGEAKEHTAGVKKAKQGIQDFHKATDAYEESQKPKKGGYKSPVGGK